MLRPQRRASLRVELFTFGNYSHRYPPQKKGIGITGKYTPLEKYLRDLPDGQGEVTLDFEQIERILNDKLPRSVYQYQAWRANQTIAIVLFQIILAIKFSSPTEGGVRCPAERPSTAFVAHLPPGASVGDKRSSLRSHRPYDLREDEFSFGKGEVEAQDC